MSKPVSFKFDCGDVVVDRITEFRGTITGRCEYMTGCRQYSLLPKMKKKDDKYPDGIWMDEDRLDLVQAINPPTPVRNPGGPSHCEPPIG